MAAPPSSTTNSPIATASHSGVRNSNVTTKNHLHLAAAFSRPAGLLCYQFTDCCGECSSPTRPRSSPLQLDPQASPDGAAPAPSNCTLHTAHQVAVKKERSLAERIRRWLNYLSKATDSILATVSTPTSVPHPSAGPKGQKSAFPVSPRIDPKAKKPTNTPPKTRPDTAVHNM